MKVIGQLTGFEHRQQRKLITIICITLTTKPSKPTPIYLIKQCDNSVIIIAVTTALVVTQTYVYRLLKLKLLGSINEPDIKAHHLTHHDHMAGDEHYDINANLLFVQIIYSKVNEWKSFNKPNITISGSDTNGSNHSNVDMQE